MTTHIDTELMLDDCSECGCPAGFEQGRQDGDTVVRARCSECCNVGGWCYSEYDAVEPWNIEQRENAAASDDPWNAGKREETKQIGGM